MIFISRQSIPINRQTLVHFYRYTATCSIAILCLLCLFACNKNKEVVEEKVPTIFINSNDATLHLVNGILFKVQEPYNGYTYELFENGDTGKLTPYWLGKQHGIKKVWYQNKHLSQERLFVHGKKEGLHKGWWENGLPKFEYNFVNDEHEGEAKEWFMNGKLAKVFHYSKGHEEGSEKMWWENGDIRSNYVIKHGQRFGLIGQKLCRNYKDSIK